MTLIGAGPASRVHRLKEIDWSLVNVPSSHPLHSAHPYPAKFPPALPQQVIERLTNPGDLVLDPFSGSGTTLLEATLMGRRAAGSDINPVAITCATAKTLSPSVEEVLGLHERTQVVLNHAEQLLESDLELSLPRHWESRPGSRFKGLGFWFDQHIARELSALKSAIDLEDDPRFRCVYEMCFSAIVVTASKQDSDTRYVRREKNLPIGSALKMFARKCETVLSAYQGSPRPETSATVEYCDARELSYVESGTVDLMLTSPPYPNAWSYHLYHQNRILWLDGDPWDFKAREIGNHRTYSASGGATSGDFLDDMTKCLSGVREALVDDGVAVVVVGDSIVRGEVVKNDDIVNAAALDAGLLILDTYERPINSRRKSFNPKIGSIRSEYILVYGK